MGMFLVAVVGGCGLCLQHASWLQQWALLMEPHCRSNNGVAESSRYMLSWLQQWHSRLRALAHLAVVEALINTALIRFVMGLHTVLVQSECESAAIQGSMA
jgi:hypothetical protein